LTYIPRVTRRPPRTSRPEHHDGGGAAVSAHLAELDRTAGKSGRASRRKEQGSHYTPPPLVGWILDRAMDGRDAPAHALDPACGAGNFLVAVAERLIARGVSPTEALCERLYGIDIDAAAVELCRARLLALLSSDTPVAERARVDASLRAQVVVGDALERSIAEVTGIREFDLIVGNPPFLNQLEVATTASRERAARIRARSQGVVGRYADLAAAFLSEACRYASRGGVVGFVMPQSFLAASDAGAMRAWVAANMRVGGLWTADERLFEDAGVRVCAVIASNEPAGRTVDLAFGPAFSALSPVEPHSLGSAPWSTLFAAARGVPEIAVSDRPNFASVAVATADFRDQFYSLKGAIVDRPDADEELFPRLVSTRHVDLAHCAWGERPVRVLFERFAAPRADRATLERDAKMAAWMRARLVPKVLVATQTKVMEAVVDERGAWLPVVPLLSVTPRAGAPIDLWMLAAAIGSPVATVEAARVSYGAALGAEAIKLSARQLLALPLPADKDAWRASARLFREASSAPDAHTRHEALHAFAAESCRAYGLGGAAASEVLRFYARRSGVR
jgi:hypothetical protein